MGSAELHHFSSGGAGWECNSGEATLTTEDFIGTKETQSFFPRCQSGAKTGRLTSVLVTTDWTLILREWRVSRLARQLDDQRTKNHLFSF